LFAKLRYFDAALNESRTAVSNPDELEEDQESSDNSVYWKLVMLNEPILGDCEVKLVGFEDPDANKAFRHSSAHILGFAIEKVFEDPSLTIGPPVQDGFFYDFYSS